MKRICLFSFFWLMTCASRSQLTVSPGISFSIQPGSSVTLQGDFTGNSDIQGPGLLLMKGSSVQNVNANGFTISNLQIDNTNNILLGGNVLIGNSLVLTNGKIQLNVFNLSIASAATISGFDNTKYILTNSTGRLIKNALGASPFTYPLGFDATTYNPLTLTQNGTADNIGVRCNQKVLSGGSNGSPFIKEVVDASWDLSESVAGGNNLNMTAGWNSGDELPG